MSWDDNYIIHPHMVASLSRARYNELNLKLISDNEKNINVMENQEVYEIMKSSLGNATKRPEKKLSQRTLTSRYLTNILNYNLGNDKYESGIRYKSQYAPEFSKIRKKSIEFLDFKAHIKSYALVMDPKTGTDELSSVFYTGPEIENYYTLTKELSEKIKKIFAYELLSSELKERQNIKKGLKTSIRKYEKEMLDFYSFISEIKSLSKDSIESGGVYYKIGILHIELEKNGLESIFVKNIKKAGEIKSFENSQLKSLKTSILSEGLVIPSTYLTQKEPTISLFRSFNTPDFEIRKYTLNKFQKEQRAREEFINDSEESF